MISDSISTPWCSFGLGGSKAALSLRGLLSSSSGKGRSLLRFKAEPWQRMPSGSLFSKTNGGTGRRPFISAP